MEQPLSEEDIKEALSKAYASAVAASAGMNFGDWPGLDRTSKDVMFEAYFDEHEYTFLSPIVVAQLKGSQDFVIDETAGVIRFDLKIKNYRDMRRQCQHPHILIVLLLHEDAKHWLNVSTDQLTMKNCAHWISLTDFPEVPNTSTKRVEIPLANKFNPDALKKLMERAARNESFQDE